MMPCLFRLAAEGVPNSSGLNTSITTSIASEIWLCLDNDDVGREAAKEIARRLGEHRCRMVELPHKDINDCLMNGMDSDSILEYMERAKFFDPDELCSAGDSSGNYRGIRTSGYRSVYKPWASLNNNFKFRAGELTLVNGVNGHGKTELVGHIAIDAMSQGVRTCIASLELKPGKMLARLAANHLHLLTEA
jgi:twinkle protein